MSEKEIQAVDVVSLKARLAALTNLALTEDPGSALVSIEDEESAYRMLADGGHETITPIGYVDGEGRQLLTGTLQTGDDFYIYMHVRVQPV